MFGSKKKEKRVELDFDQFLEANPFQSKKSLKELLKYELVQDLRYPQDTTPDDRSISACRIRALIDIPEHGVKAGDLGGFVEDASILSHQGTCWVGGNALAARVFEPSGRFERDLPNMISGSCLVTGYAFTRQYIRGQAVIKDNAVVLGKVSGDVTLKDNVRFMAGAIEGKAVIGGNVHIIYVKISASTAMDANVIIDGDIQIDIEGGSVVEPFIKTTSVEEISIRGKGRFNNVNITGNLDFNAEVNLESVIFQGNTTILGKPQIKPNVKFTGNNVISGDALIPPNSHVHDVQMSSGILNYKMPISPSEHFQHSPPPASMTVPQYSIQATPQFAPQHAIQTNATATVINDEISEYIETIKQIEADYQTYTTDIVKLIKYPGMVDTSIPEVGNFVVKLRSIKRSMKTARVDVLASKVEDLELAFVNAENKVQTLVTSHLSDDSKKSLKTAEQMFALACNDASTEPEKRLGYKAGMKALEGVVAVSEIAVEQMKVKVGILELEA